MKHLMIFASSVGLALTMCAVAAADIEPMIALSNEFGYSGTLQNLTMGSSTSVNIPAGSSPRDGVIYLTIDPSSSSGYSGNANDIQFNWYQSPETNQSFGSFQINDTSSVTLTSAVGTWSQEGVSPLWDFSVVASGGSATSANSSAGLWGVPGTFTSYNYDLVATGMSTTVMGDEWRYNESDPTGITGSFNGTFTDPSSGDNYQVSLTFDKSLWDGTDFSDTFDDVNYGTYSSFAGPVPEPGSLGLLAGGSLGIGAFFWRRQKRKSSPSSAAQQSGCEKDARLQDGEPPILSLTSCRSAYARRAA